MLKKYMIVICCITAICICLGHTANLTYEDFQAVGDFLSADDTNIAAEVELVSKLGAWFSVYDVDYVVDLIVRENGHGYVDYIFIEETNTLTLIIDGDDYDAGIATDLRRIANMLVHTTPPDLSDEETQPVLLELLSGLISIYHGFRYIIALIYSLIVILFHSLPLVVELLRALLYLLGFSNNLV